MPAKVEAAKHPSQQKVKTGIKPEGMWKKPKSKPKVFKSEWEKRAEYEARVAKRKQAAQPQPQSQPQPQPPPQEQPKQPKESKSQKTQLPAETKSSSSSSSFHLTEQHQAPLTSIPEDSGPTAPSEENLHSLKQQVINYIIHQNLVHFEYYLMYSDSPYTSPAAYRVLPSTIHPHFFPSLGWIDYHKAPLSLFISATTTTVAEILLHTVGFGMSTAESTEDVARKVFSGVSELSADRLYELVGRISSADPTFQPCCVITPMWK